MFCPLARLELKVTTCPVNTCVYRTAVSSCGYEQLTAEEVDAQDIAELKGQKLYKVKNQLVEGRAAIELGMVALKYSQFIVESFPSFELETKSEKGQTVNKTKDSTKDLLKRLFGLSTYQQEKFLCPERYKDWAGRHGISVEFNKLWDGLIKAGRNN